MTLNHNDEQVYTEEQEMSHVTYVEGMAKEGKVIGITRHGGTS